ncbi:glyoxylate reductase/hydroxypyruvate reductase-like isoform X2 [Dermacentor variabilis]|uniref:glyoxylate reductase/hydroxypyruvate reductase-like isoform X2 n=1 Tax=Dermacentor variabilis TaxID=34621 RepID=UPI003F5B009F
MWHFCQPLFNVRRVFLTLYTPSFTNTVLQRLSSMGPVRKPAVLVTRQDVAKEALDLLLDKCDVEIWNEDEPIPRPVLLRKIAGKDALFCLVTEKVDSELLDAAGPSLKVVGTMSVGYDHVNVAECTRRRIAVGNTPHVLTDATAELGIGLLLATARRLLEAHQAIGSGEWAKAAMNPTWMCGSEIRGSTVGIVGMGGIGFAILERLKAFKVSRFLYHSRSHKTAAEAMGAQFTTLEELLRQSDFVIVCCALTPETKGMFNEQAFSMMKSTASFINISRGQVVDQEALYEALTSGKIRSAGLDVMTPEPLPKDHPLSKLPNCVLLNTTMSSANRRLLRYSPSILTPKPSLFNSLYGALHVPLLFLLLSVSKKRTKNYPQLYLDYLSHSTYNFLHEINLCWLMSFTCKWDFYFTHIFLLWLFCPYKFGYVTKFVREL